MSEQQTTIMQEADHLLTFLHLCEDEKHSRHAPLLAMDGAIPFLHAGARKRDRDDLMIPVNAGVPAVWPVDIATVQPAMIGSDGWPSGSLQFNRFQTIKAAQARKHGALIFSPRMALEMSTIAIPDGTARSSRYPLAQLGGKWVDAAPTKPEISATDRRISLTLGMALSVRYEWTVWIGHSSGPRIRFLSSPAGAMEAFRLRDLPPGRLRRAALRNWVEAYSRRLASNDDAVAWVKKHLRGTTDFVWNGMRCRIEPPAFDMERLAAD